MVPEVKNDGVCKIWYKFKPFEMRKFFIFGRSCNNSKFQVADKENILFIFLQSISRRIHYGKYVAEAKFTDAPQDYSTAISSEVGLIYFVPLENVFVDFCY